MLEKSPRPQDLVLIEAESAHRRPHDVTVPEPQAENKAKGGTGEVDLKSCAS
jgi:hypothetical protein